MPVSHQFDSGVLVITAAGQYAPEDALRVFVAAMNDPACPTPSPLLVDVRQSEVLASRTPEQIRTVAEFLKPYAERIGRRCAVVASLDVHYGLSRMGTVFAGNVGVEAQVFRTMEDAVSWLRTERPAAGTGGAAR